MTAALTPSFVYELVALSEHSHPASSCDARDLQMMISEGIETARGTISEQAERIDELEGDIEALKEEAETKKDKAEDIQRKLGLSERALASTNETLALRDARIADLERADQSGNVIEAERCRALAREILDHGRARKIGARDAQRFAERLGV